MSWIEPITNRTEAACTELRRLAVKIDAAGGLTTLTAAELAAWVAGLGGLDHVDLNRIEGNTKIISDLLDGFGYNNSMTTKEDWAETDLHFAAQTERIRNNVETLTEVYHDEKPLTYADVGAQTYAAYGATVYADLFGTTVPLALRLHYADFNNLELALLNLGSMVDRLAQSFEYCGETYSGE